MRYNYFQDSEFYALLSPKELVTVYNNDQLRENRDELRAILNEIRKSFGQPITINSWFRDPEHNELAGGKPSSQHLCGEAVDITSCNNDLLMATIRSLCKHGMELGQIIQYGSTVIRFIHISLATRGKVNQFLRYE